MGDLASRSAVAHAGREGTTCEGVGFAGEMGGDGGGGWRMMSHSVLDEAQIDAGLQPMGGIAVSQGVPRSTLVDTTVREGCPEGLLHTGAGHGRGGGGHADTATAWSGAKPGGMAVRFPVLAQ